MYCYTQCPQPAAGHHRSTPLPETPGPSWASLGQSLVGSLLLSPGFCLCPPRAYFPVLCKFWQPYGGVSGDLLQEGLCHTQVCYTQSPCPCGSLLVTCTSTGDAPTHFSLSFCGVSGSWCIQGLFEPSEHLWREWSLILNANSPLLPSFWGFSFVLECGVSPQSHSSAMQLPLQCCAKAALILELSLPQRDLWTLPSALRIKDILYPGHCEQA